jgi:hypothetical protein
MQFVSGADKEYVAEVVLGSRTSTLDDSGEVLETFNMSAVAAADVQRVVREHCSRRQSSRAPSAACMMMLWIRSCGSACNSKPAIG